MPMQRVRDLLPQTKKQACGHETRICCTVCMNCYACCRCDHPQENFGEAGLLPKALSSADGRKQLAHLLVWGSPNELRIISRHVIEARIVDVLERISNIVEVKH